MVYLLCFDRKLHHARHYIGFAENQRTFEARMKHHSKGSGSRLMAAIAKAGIGFCVARTWPDGDRNFERKLKNRKKSSELCPHCTAAKKLEKKRRSQDLAQDAMIAKSTEPITCPVVETAKTYDLQVVDYRESRLSEQGPTVPDLLAKAKEILNDQSQGDALRSRWARIRNRVARLWLVLKDKLVSK